MFSLWCSFVSGSLTLICLYDMSRVQCLIVLFTVSLVWPALLSLFIRTLIFSSSLYGKINAYKKTKMSMHFLVWMEILGFSLKDDSLNKSVNVSFTHHFSLLYFYSLTCIETFLFDRWKIKKMCVWFPVTLNLLLIVARVIQHSPIQTTSLGQICTGGSKLFSSPSR